MLAQAVLGQEAAAIVQAQGQAWTMVHAFLLLAGYFSEGTTTCND